MVVCTANVAVTFLLASMVMLHVFAPEHAPDHPVKAKPESGTAGECYLCNGKIRFGAVRTAVDACAGGGGDGSLAVLCDDKDVRDCRNGVCGALYGFAVPRCVYTVIFQGSGRVDGNRRGVKDPRAAGERIGSDLATCDIDGDGVPELATIEPFHCSNFRIYHKTKDGYAAIYNYPENLPFCHAVWGGQLRSKSVFIGGCRGGNRELFMLRWEAGRMSTEIIDKGCGTANVMVIHGPDQDLLVAANREVGEGAVYFVRD